MNCGWSVATMPGAGAEIDGEAAGAGAGAEIDGEAGGADVDEEAEEEAEEEERSVSGMGSLEGRGTEVREEGGRRGGRGRGARGDGVGGGGRGAERDVNVAGEGPGDEEGGAGGAGSEGCRCGMVSARLVVETNKRLDLARSSRVIRSRGSNKTR
jgi:hypothetical protein